MLKHILYILFCCHTHIVVAQIMVEGKIPVQGQNSLVSLYSTDHHQLVDVEQNGNFQVVLPRYEECILVFYGTNLLPQCVSIYTDEPYAKAIPLNIQLEKGDFKRKAYLLDRPLTRISTKNSSFQKKEFNLDDIVDKAKYANVIQEVSRDMKAFYTEKKIPVEKENTISTNNLPTIKQTEHQLGERIYQLSNQKKSLVAQLEQLRKQIPAPDASDVQRCLYQQKILKKETNLHQLELDLSQANLDKAILELRRKELDGQTPSNRSVRKYQKEVDIKKKQLTISTLNWNNQKADCEEYKLLAKSNFSSTATDSEKAIQKATLYNIYLKKRLNNARNLTKQHNALANTLTGRDRIVALANAQKSISEQEEIKLYQLDNQVTIWKNRATYAGQYQQQIDAAIQSYEKQRDQAWNAEMAYLEHMWHLRDQPSVKELVGDIYNQQSGLVVIAPTRELEEDTSEKATILSNVNIQQTNDSNTDNTSITLEEDVYEITIDKKGNKRYFKNGSPITKLTYRFETQRKFGEMIENVKEEQEKNTLWKFFKEKISNL